MTPGLLVQALHTSGAATHPGLPERRGGVESDVSRRLLLILLSRGGLREEFELIALATRSRRVTTSTQVCDTRHHAAHIEPRAFQDGVRLPRRRPTAVPRVPSKSCR